MRPCPPRLPVLILVLLMLSACSLPEAGAAPQTPAPRPPEGTLLPTGTPFQPGAATARPTAPGSTPAGGVLTLTLPLGEPQPAPDGILPQLGIFQTGGGSGYAGADCESRSGEVRWCTPFNGNPLALTEAYIGTACGFASQVIEAAVVLPDGSTQAVETQGEPPYCWEVRYTPGPNAPLGKYQITVSQGSLRLSDSFQLVKPGTPSATVANHCAWLAGFPPNREARLLIFGLTPPGANASGPDASLATWRFIAERRLNVPASGSVLACPDPAGRERYPELAYLAYPSGGAVVLAGDEDILAQFQGQCAGGPPTRLTPGKTARVQVDNLPLFPDPTFTTAAAALLPRQTQVTLLGAPTCPPQGPWVWPVKTPDGKTGWLPESDAVGYFLAP